MRLLVLGGSVFCSRAVAAEAVRRGHEVTAACRGESGTLPDGVRHLRLDRSAATAAEVATALGDGWDAVVDVARQPGWVRASAAACPSAHHVFVSTVNVYPDTVTRGGSPASLAVHEPLPTDGDELGPVSYGRRKVACEQSLDGVASHEVVRPGLIVGPGDPSGRYSYWPRRLARSAPGERVLAPGDPDDAVQVIDVRDLAAWLVDGAEQQRGGVVDGVGPVTTRGQALAAIARGVGADPRWVWADEGVLDAHRVAPWAGPRSLPLWLPVEAYGGLMTHDPAPAREAGLHVRPAEETAADTAAWVAATADAPVGGLTPAEEAEVLAALP